MACGEPRTGARLGCVRYGPAGAGSVCPPHGTRFGAPGRGGKAASAGSLRSGKKGDRVAPIFRNYTQDGPLVRNLRLAGPAGIGALGAAVFMHRRDCAALDRATLAPRDEAVQALCRIVAGRTPPSSYRAQEL